ncbi:hypothetical protein ILYODFUR_028949 [Ilyodon furcidens]|uniref:Uncharacterized protein n=1 Tax=Ilyodon furcidens TaxID=33524 RepID=A0ABV0TFV4_9TELE
MNISNHPTNVINKDEKSRSKKTFLTVDVISGLHGGTGSKVALKQKGPGFDSHSAWNLHVLVMHVWVRSRYSGFLPQSKNMTVRSIGLSQLPLGVMRMCTVVCPVCFCVALRWTGNLSRVSPSSRL